MKYKYFFKNIRNFYNNQQASTAVEFAFVIAPILGIVFILIDIGFWTIANSTIKSNTYAFYDKWIIEDNKSSLIVSDVRINICANMLIIGVSCDDNNLIMNITDSPPANVEHQFSDNLQGVNIPVFTTKVVLLRVRLIWSQAFPVSNFIIRSQNAQQNSIYASVLLPTE